MKTRFFRYIAAALAAIILYVGNTLGADYGWYTSVPIYDVYMHLFGGFAIGLLVLAVFPHLKIRQVFGLVFLAGIAWEAFETYFNIAGAPVGTTAYYIDTVKDLVDDSIGGVVAYFISRKVFK